MKIQKVSNPARIYERGPCLWHIYYWLLFLQWKYIVTFKSIGTKPVLQELFASPSELVVM